MISFEDVCTKDLNLIVDEIYSGGNKGNISDEVLSKLLGVGNSGGFRWRNYFDDKRKAFIVLYTSGENQDWADTLDIEMGKFKYYGDNKNPGTKLTDTAKKGNTILEELYNEKDRSKIPPVLLFQKVITKNSSRSVKFLGLAVPEDYHLGKDESLKGIWRTTRGGRFQNYEAHFTILNTEEVSYEWLQSLIYDSSDKHKYTPSAWTKYLTNGLSEEIILRAPKTKEYRTKDEQLPSNQIDSRMLEQIYDYYKDDPHKFEHFATKIVGLMDHNFITFDVTRPSKDGGYDALGKYKIGHPNSSIKLRCAIEAKCYSGNNGNGVKLLSRLISRLRYRDFGIFVTTSYVSQQAYKEILEDEHPIIIISGIDIINILKKNHISDETAILNYLSKI